MADAIFDQGELGMAAQALMRRKQQLAAQEAAATGGAPAQVANVPLQGAMPQSQFSGYQANRQMTPQQLMQLATLLARRNQP